MAKRELSNTLKNLKFMQRGTQRVEKTKKVEEEVILDRNFPSSSTAKKCWEIWRRVLNKTKQLLSWTGWSLIRPRKAFRGRVRLLLSGAAPLPRHVEEFLRVACCTVLSQGYEFQKVYDI